MRSGQMTPLFQRVWLALGLALVFLLSGCGGAGTKYNEFIPKRIVLIGDEVTYLGCGIAAGDTVCTGSDWRDRYSVNNTGDTTAPVINNWVWQLATLYGLTSDQIVEPTLQKAIPGSPSASDHQKRRYAKLGAKVADIRAQAFTTGSLPAYATGDMLVLAGGMHDVLDILNDNSITTDTSGITLERNLSPTVMIKEAKATDLPVGKAYRIMQAAQQYQDLAFDLMAAGQRNVFVVPIYDVSNSPDLATFCASCAATPTLAQQAFTLFNLTLKNFTDASGNSYPFKPGAPRVLVATGYTATDASYVNITQFTTVAGIVSQFITAYSVCGPSPAPAGDLSSCNWNGLFTTTLGVDPAVSQAVTAAVGSGFIDTSGAYIYASKYYLTPRTLQGIGVIFYTYMRGFQGW